MEIKIEQTGAVVPFETEPSEAQPEPQADVATEQQVDAEGTVQASGDADGAVSEPAPEQEQQQPLTEALLRKLRAKYFTVRHQRLEQCGHKFDEINQPRHANCENCWFQWFNTHPKLVEVTDQFLRTEGATALIGMRGEKYLKMFRRYMSTVIRLMKEEGRLNGVNSDGRVGSTLVSGEEVGTDGNPTSPVEGGEAESSGHVEQVSEQAIRDAVVAEAGQDETSSPAIYID
jgi:hypothetical protein